MKKILLGLLVVISIIGLISCENAANPLETEIYDLSEGTLAKRGNPAGSLSACSALGTSIGTNEAGETDYGIYEYTLWAGKQHDAGTVTITNDAESISITFNTNTTANLEEVHVYIWTDLEDVPVRRPIPGHADYIVENINADSYTVVIPADLTCGDAYYISAHAALNGESPECDCEHDDNNEECDHDGDGNDNHDNGYQSNAGETAYAGDASSPDCFDASKGAWWGYVNYGVECFIAPPLDPPDYCEAVTHTLWVNETVEAGSVTISNTDGYVLLEYTALNGNTFTGLAVNILSEVPSERGDAALYTYNKSAGDKGFTANLDNYTFDINLTNLLITECDQPFYIIASATMGGALDTEIAFAGPAANGTDTGSNQSGGWDISSVGDWFYYISSGVCCPGPSPQ